MTKLEMLERAERQWLAWEARATVETSPEARAYAFRRADAWLTIADNARANVEPSRFCHDHQKHNDACVVA